MSKSRKEELAIFLSKKGRISYNGFCRKCSHKCKQSFRVAVVCCPKFLSKRNEKAGGG